MSKKKPQPKKPAPKRSRAKKTKPDLRSRVLRGPDNRPETTMPERIRVAMAELETGDPPERVADRLAAMFGVEARQARRYIRKAREMITKLLEREAPHARGQRIRRLSRASRGAEAVKDWRGVVAAEKEIAELQGLYVVKHELGGAVGSEAAGLLKALALNPHDQRRRLAELEAKEAAALAASLNRPHAGITEGTGTGT